VFAAAHEVVIEQAAEETKQVAKINITNKNTNNIPLLRINYIIY